MKKDRTHAIILDKFAKIFFAWFLMFMMEDMKNEVKKIDDEANMIQKKIKEKQRNLIRKK